VLSAVFVPCAFISGITGQFFRQFALTIAVSTVISAFNSLTLSPALAALLLKPRDQGSRNPLPWPAYLAAGGAAGWAFLAPRLAGRVALGAWEAGPAAAVAGALAGLALSWPLNQMLRGLFWLFNFGFRHTTNVYARLVGLALRGSLVVLVVYGGLVLLTWYGLVKLPAGWIPQQDKGYLMASVQLPDAASLERTEQVVERVDKICHETKGVAHTIGISGQSFTLGAYGPNFGNFFIPLEDFDKRHDPRLSADAVAVALRKRIAAEVPDAIVTVFGAPPVQGLGTAGGFKFIIEDRGDLGLEELQKQTEHFIAVANDGHFRVTAQSLAALGDKQIPAGVWAPLRELKGRPFETRSDFLVALGGVLDRAGVREPAERARVDGLIVAAARVRELTGLMTVFRANAPQLYVDVNREQASKMGVQLSDIFMTLQVYLGSMYVNDFNKFGRTWQVVVQAEGPFRDEIEDVRRLRVRNADGGMVPLGAVATVREINGPLLLTRYNMYPAAAVNGNSAPGVSSGQAIKLVDALARRELPHAMALEWTEISYMQIQAGDTAMSIFGLSVLLVFLVLAALYESWSLPLAIILVVPMCILGSITGVWLSHSDVNIFTQIGFVVLVGLASKNAILIVEFAKLKREAGAEPREATLEAVRLRLRPILMTSFAFILGVVPLLLAVGAGAEMRRTLGTAVFAGMLGVTLFGIFLTPVFFYVIDWVSEAEVFATPAMRGTRTVLLRALGVLTLGLLWALLLLFRELRKREAPVVAADSSGERRPEGGC
jgi:multidrug efflux pump